MLLSKKEIPFSNKSEKIDRTIWFISLKGKHFCIVSKTCRYGRIFRCNLFGKQAVVSADPYFNRFIIQHEEKLFQSCYPKSFRDLVGRNGVIVVHGQQQRKLHGIAMDMMRAEKLNLNSHFLADMQMVMLRALSTLQDNHVIVLQDLCRKASEARQLASIPLW